MKKLLIAFVFCLGVPAHAAVTSSSAFASFNSHIYGSVGFTQGGFAFGADYEMGYHRTFGIGGYARIYSKDTAKGAHGITLAGAFIRPHFHRGSWDFHLTGGFAIQSITAGTTGGKDETALGPALGYAMFYHLKDELSLGLERLDHFGWIADNYKGPTMSDLAFKVRFSF